MKMLSYTRTFLLEGGTRDELDEQTDLLMDVLSEMEDDCLLDSSVSVDLKERIVEISVTVQCEDDYDKTLEIANARILDAIHAAGAHPQTLGTVSVALTDRDVPMLA